MAPGLSGSLDEAIFRLAILLLIGANLTVWRIGPNSVGRPSRDWLRRGRR